MRIMIIAHMERNYMPYVEKYIEILKQTNVEYKLLVWNREEVIAEKEDEYSFYLSPRPNKFSKLLGYFSYRSFVLRRIKVFNPDKLIVITSLPAIMLYSDLINKFKGKYWFDIRDYSFEKYAWYKKRMDRLIENSYKTSISSLGFKQFLSESDKFIVNHNVNVYKEQYKAKELIKPITIGFVGGVRYYDENVRLIEALKNNPDYRLLYVGKEIPGRKLSDYVKENGINNVDFIGKYQNSEKENYYQKIDMINSIYGNGSLEVTTALPNRLYDAAMMRKPIISSKGTYLGQLIREHKLGFALDTEKDDILEEFRRYLLKYQSDIFEENCLSFIMNVDKDELELKKIFIEWIHQ